MASVVLELSIELAEAVQPLLGRIEARDKNLEDVPYYEDTRDKDDQRLPAARWRQYKSHASTQGG
jgi:hypothetical protein